MRNRKQAFDFFIHIRDAVGSLIRDCHTHAYALSPDEFYTVVGFCQHFYYALNTKLLPMGFADVKPESMDATHTIFSKDHLLVLSKIAFTEFNSLHTSQLHALMFNQNHSPFGKFVTVKLSEIAVQLGAFVAEYVPIDDIFTVDCMVAFKTFITCQDGRLLAHIREQLFELHQVNMKTYQYFDYENASLFLSSALLPIRDLLQSVTDEDVTIRGPRFPIFSSETIWTEAFSREKDGMVETVFRAIEKDPDSLRFESAKIILEGLYTYSVWYKLELASKCLQIALSDLKLHMHYAQTVPVEPPPAAGAEDKSDSSDSELKPLRGVLFTPDSTAALTEIERPLPPMPPLVLAKEKPFFGTGHISFLFQPTTPPFSATPQPYRTYDSHPMQTRFC